jgi:putative transposase
MCCHERQHLFRHVRLDLHAGELQFAPTAIKIKEMDFKIWQRNYFEHIIRNAESHNKIAAYIRNNPANWQEDEYFL